jgi:hypothetical protein
VVAFAGSSFSLGNPTNLGEIKLKVGQYEVSVKKAQAVITGQYGKTISVPVRIEQADKKFSITSALTRSENGGEELTEIDIEGTTTRLIFGQ